LSSIDIGSREAIKWSWRPTNQVRALLEALAQAGILGFARRQGNRRYYDFVERLFPPDLLANRPDPYEQRLHRLLSRYRGHGLLGRTGSAELWSQAAPATRAGGYDGPLRGDLLATLLERGELVPVAVEGVRGDRFVLREEVALLEEAARDAERADVAAPWTPLDPARAGVALLAPLDPLVWDRDFLRALYGFDYLWEVYIPARKRQWGYYVLPLFWGDRFVGRIEPRIDRPDDALRILNLYWEAGFRPADHPAFVRGLADALDAHRRFAGVGRVLLPRSPATASLRPLLAEHLPALGRPARRAAVSRTRRSPRRVAVGR
jgi:uncharacterized protein YcaQ